MATQVVHRERLAWDAALVVVRALGSDQVGRWLHGRMAAQLGADSATALAESRQRLWSSPRLDASQVEAGIWRARLAELLAADVALAGPLRELMAEAAERLAVATDIRIPGQVTEPAGPRVIDLDRHRA